MRAGCGRVRAMVPIELVLGAPAAGGGFVGRAPDGRVVFARHGIEGERVLAELTEEHATWARADVTQVLEPSADRVAPPCPYAGPGRCGGCDYQHVDLAAQRALKSRRVRDQLRALARIESDVEVAPVGSALAGLGTRTRVRFATDDDGRLSMRRHRSHELVAVDRCILGVAAIGTLDLGAHAFPSGAGVEAVALAPQGEPTVAVTIETRARARVRHTTARTEVLEGPGLAGSQATAVAGHSFWVSPGVFWQVHKDGPELLCDEVLRGLDLKEGDRVADLYCGAGLFTAMAARVVGPSGVVVGIDASSTATSDAVGNVAAMPWARVVTSPVAADVVRDEAIACTHAVLDPPRRGVDRSALDALSEIPSLRRLASVSCDASTFARDLRILLDAGWRVASIRAFDLFEMTEHVECVAVLER
jgi:tRNA/tmRNA/rRNA uracil-C5-methylase (TrmA/RlmC/RlmD family)